MLLRAEKQLALWGGYLDFLLLHFEFICALSSFLLLQLEVREGVDSLCLLCVSHAFKYYLYLFKFT